MLQLQRASAGSGKTYTLAKKYIWYLIAVKDKNGHWRLRKSREISDGLSRILAITFTNKATNEMKQRIVVRLKDLAATSSKASLTDEEIKRVDYLSDFMHDLGLTDHMPIARAASEALSFLLNDYGSFKVSTIDAFFQTILRTFAYEVNLNDSFHIEIDTMFLSSYAVDATLDKVNSSSHAGTATFWMQELMDRRAASEKSDWNVFSQSTSRYSLANEIKAGVRKLEKEDYREARRILDAYFENIDNCEDPLRVSYERLEKELREGVRASMHDAKEAAKALLTGFEKAGLDVKVHGLRWMDSHIDKILKSSDNPKKLADFKPLALKGTALKKGVTSSEGQKLADLAAEMYEKWEMVQSFWMDQKWKHWRVYRELIPMLGLISEARKEINKYLDGVNSIHLAETSSILNRIIGDSDVPFVYERIGSTINHYLIDEFQDTSRLQWDILRPLVGESLSRGEDNLIIGDAKQSIYRFRSADPSLITTAVPASFPDFCNTVGLSRDENTNHRSDRNVIEFNNMFFKLLTSRLNDFSKGVVDFSELYSNVSQYSRKREREGYVEINFIDRPVKKLKKQDDIEEQDDYTANLLPRLGPLVDSLLNRGYDQKDIAFLVRTNAQGKAVIEALRDHNSKKKIGERHVEFISEESLLVSSAESVRMIITVLEKMAAGVYKSNRKDGTAGRYVDWNEIKCNFNFFSLRHPELTMSAQVEQFLESEEIGNPIGEMLSKMQAIALPALVEAIIEQFVPHDLRRSQAAFLAAFQDIVLKYCSTKSADVASFLSWWKEMGVGESIQSPSGLDAVQVMTIHKSKGLEFSCVIVPFAHNSLFPSPTSSEWRWVKPTSLLDGYGLPEVLPVQTTIQLDGTDHQPELASYHDMTVMDNLNIAYVAFTRAVSELYVFTYEPSQTSKGGMGNFLHDLCAPNEEELDLNHRILDENCLRPEDVVRSEGGKRYSFGTRKVYVDRCRKEEDPSSIISEYGVNSSSRHLLYTESSDEGGQEVVPEAADTDPRSEGNLIHAILAGVRNGEDIARNAKTLTMRGLLKRDKADEWVAWLRGAIKGESVREWFSDKWRVLSERSLLIGNTTQIPDRLLIDRDGKRAVVIDYKTGEVPSDNRHKKQVAAYMLSVREATGIEQVEGYVWYLRKDTIIKV